MVILKTDKDLALMRQAGRIVAEVLALLREQVKPGITMLGLDALAEDEIRKRGAIPSFKEYPNNIPGGKPFPASICASINEELVHGIPDDRPLQEGDIVSIDCGAIYQGYHGDSAITVPVGQITLEAQALLETTESALYLGIAQAQVGNRIGDITSAIQRHV
jgi:methionyl aminopeptidase